MCNVRLWLVISCIIYFVSKCFVVLVSFSDVVKYAVWRFGWKTHIFCLIGTFSQSCSASGSDTTYLLSRIFVI